MILKFHFSMSVSEWYTFCLIINFFTWFSGSECRSKREMPHLYTHAKGIMYALKDKGIDMAIASRSPTPDIAKTFLTKLEIQSMFVAQVSATIFFYFLFCFSFYPNKGHMLGSWHCLLVFCFLMHATLRKNMLLYSLQFKMGCHHASLCQD